jgi:hypothetical protein
MLTMAKNRKTFAVFSHLDGKLEVIINGTSLKVSDDQAKKIVKILKAAGTDSVTLEWVDPPPQKN